MLINKFSDVARYKINIQKSVAFINTNYELSEIFKKRNPIYNYMKNHKIPRNIFNLGEKPYIESSKTLIKEIEANK